MALLLTNEHVDSVLDVAEAIAAMEAAYQDLADHRAVNVPRTDAYAPHPSGEQTYALKFFAGLIPRTGLAALRIDSDVISWEPYHGNLRKEKRGVSDGRWNGLVLLYSIANGELVGIMPDGVVQRMRVAVTNALAPGISLGPTPACTACWARAGRRGRRSGRSRPFGTCTTSGCSARTGTTGSSSPGRIASSLVSPCVRSIGAGGRQRRRHRRGGHQRHPAPDRA